MLIEGFFREDIITDNRQPRVSDTQKCFDMRKESLETRSEAC